MNALHRPRPVAERRAGLLARLRQAVPAITSRAPALDAAGAFPAEDIDALRGIGLLAAPLPEALGGLGMGTEPDGAADLLTAFRTLGGANLSVGRLFEGHVNALRLVVRIGRSAQARQAAADALAGALFGVWNTDDPAAPLRLGPDFTLRGARRSVPAPGMSIARWSRCQPRTVRSSCCWRSRRANAPTSPAGPRRGCAPAAAGRCASMGSP